MNSSEGKKISLPELRALITSEVQKSLNEDYARGIPDFALSNVAASTAEGMRQHMKRYINQMSQDPAKQRQMLAAANFVLEEIEEDVKQLLEDKLMDFLRKT